MSNKKLFKISADFIYAYISFIHTYIKVNKSVNETINKADEDFDMYEVLFIEGLNRALKAEAGVTTFDTETLDNVSGGIKRILKEQGVYGKCLLNRQLFILICTKVFQHLVEETQTRHGIEKEDKE